MNWRVSRTVHWLLLQISYAIHSLYRLQLVPWLKGPSSLLVRNLRQRSQTAMALGLKVCLRRL